MTLIKIIETFTFYGFDILALAAVTAIVVQVLKITVFKKLKKKKILTIFPFLIGTLFYAAYAAAIHLSLYYLVENYAAVLENGFSVGMAATLFYVFYEQFVREKSSLSMTEGVISTLIEGYVPTDSVEKVAKEVAEAIQKDVTGNGAAKAAEIISKNSEENVTEHDIQLLCKLIIETLAHISTT